MSDRDDLELNAKVTLNVKAVAKVIENAVFHMDPESIEAIVEGVLEGLQEQMPRGRVPTFTEEGVKIPKTFIVGREIIVPRLNGFAPIAEKVAQFAKLEKASADIAVYRINRVSLWKGAELGISPDEVIEILKTHSPSPPTKSLRDWISRTMSAYGALIIEGEKNYNVLVAVDVETMDRILAYKDVKSQVYKRLGDTRARIIEGRRAVIKRLLMERGYPVKDYGLMEEFDPLKIEWKPGKYEALWDHQKEAIARIVKARNGVVILPPGGGKTRVAVGATVELKAPTLVVTNKAQICEQIKKEYLENTTISSYDITVIHGQTPTRNRHVRNITITTYQMLSSSLRAKSTSRSSRLIRDIWKTKWGLIVFDEVQHVPADVWRVVAEDLQGLRKLGLTATPVREDKKEREIFSLVGPPLIDINWLEMAEEGRIANVTAYEVLVSMSQNTRKEYNRTTTMFSKVLVATHHPEKTRIIKRLVERHRGSPTLVIGYYLDQAHKVAKALQAPLVYGETSHKDRELLYQAFRDGEVPVLVLTSVGEEGIDLPNARVAISMATLYGSRMGFSQRFGRILRVHEDKDKAIFYEVVTEGTIEQDYSERRREYLLAQGYDFDTLDLTNIS